MSARKKIRPKQEELPLLDDLFGERAARRLRVGSVLAILLLFAGGCTLYVLVSQTFGTLLLLPAAFWATCWILFRAADEDGDIDAPVRARRIPVLTAGVLLFVLGWIAFFTLDQDLGLLLVLLGSLPVLIVAVVGGVTTDPVAAASDAPLSGPPYGETSG